MTPEQLVARIERMAAAASARLKDADVLEQSLRTTSNSGYLLRLLAFEILLKALVRINGVPPQKSHSYLDLFHALPDIVRDRVVGRAADRMSTSANYSSLPELLDTFSSNFTALRYPYEAYESVSAGAFREAGKGWVERGAQESEATFVYYPEELFGLTFALEGEVQDWLKSAR
jgi:hypothetical protein